MPMDVDEYINEELFNDREPEDPTPEEIRQECLRIREHWSEDERRVRAGHSCLPAAAVSGRRTLLSLCSKSESVARRNTAIDNVPHSDTVDKKLLLLRDQPCIGYAARKRARRDL